ncbi:flagellar FlbD family protein [Granulicella cerasi]|uniref:Flagellar FlbD family protein n=1 Tax=Granulicella cerasi TaxID=741063 RepID=A0ABW1ZCS5_9BACT|nr:flagellar FlbD family protein [Granulicella cerasi]
MIELTRLNGNSITINCDLIRYAEATPDTTLTLVTGEKLIVREPIDVVVARTFHYRVSLMQTAWPSADIALAARTHFDAQHNEPTKH